MSGRDIAHKCSDFRHLLTVVLHSKMVFVWLCLPFHSMHSSHIQVFLCDNVRIIIIKEKRGIGLERAVFQIPFFDAFFAWGMKLPTAPPLCRESLAWGVTSYRQALCCVSWASRLQRVKSFIPLSLSAVIAASSIPPELNIAAAGRGGVKHVSWSRHATCFPASIPVCTVTNVKCCTRSAAHISNVIFLSTHPLVIQPRSCSCTLKK